MSLNADETVLDKMYYVVMIEKPSQRVYSDLENYFNNKDNLSLFTYPHWDNISRITGQNVIRLMVYKQGDNHTIYASCGLTFIPSHFFGRRIVSTGFFTGGNIIWDNHDALDILIHHIYDIGKSLGVDFIEFKDTIFPEHIVNKYKIQTNNTVYAQFIKPIADNILESIPCKKRADIRKALANKNLSFKKDISFDDFYDIYTISQRNLGTPVHKKSFYQAILNHIPLAKLYGIFDGEQIVAVCMTLEDTKTVMPYYAGCLPDAKKTHAYDLMYYHIMIHAGGLGRTIFDFGRSKYHTGAFDYKTFWGFQSTPITHSYIMVKGNSIPDNTPLNPKYQLKIKLWRILPVWLTNFISPLIMKHLA